jgi:succinyl-diaminopimelate desuccinylase
LDNVSRFDKMDEKEKELVKQVEHLKPEIIQLTRALVRIPSPSGQENEAQSFVRSKLREIGFKVESHSKVSSRPNLLANLEFSKRGRNLLFVAHIDNILPGNREGWRYDPFSARLVNGRIYGRGVADMKAALAAMIVSAKAISNSKIQEGTVSLASVVDEEIESEYGMKYLYEKKLIRADACIFGEPSFPFVATALKGGIWLKLVSRGKKVGSGWPSEGVNAVMKMAKVLCALEDLDMASGFKAHPFLGKPSIAPGTTIRGGDQLHSIPDRCEATVEVYMVPGQKSEDVVSMIKDKISELHRFDRTLSVEVQTLFETEPVMTTDEDKIYRDLQSSIASIFKKRAEPIGVPSIGDARFTSKLGIPTIAAYGPGERAKGHVSNESVSVHVLTNVTKVYALTAYRFLKKERRLDGVS